MPDNNQKPIFIIGCERSGTTLIRLILHSHPRIALPPQTKFLKKIYKRRLRWRDLRKLKNRRRLADWFTNHFDKRTKLPDLGLNPDVIRLEVVASANTLGAAASGVFKLYSSKFDKPRWGDKRPYYIKYLRQLLTLFPDAQIIHVIRDGRDCIASLKNMPWWKQNLPYTILNWQEAIHKGKRARSLLPKEQYFEIRYEDFISHPEKWTREICNFLGETFYPEMLQFQKTAQIAVPDYKMPWHSTTRESLSSAAIGRWQRDLEKWQIGLIEKKVGRELKEWNYQLSNMKYTVPFREQIKFYWELVKYRTQSLFLTGLDRFMSFFYPWPLDYQFYPSKSKEGPNLEKEL